MGIFERGATKLANHNESMRSAEGKLMSFANRFGANTTEKLELFDTAIPRAAVPLHDGQRCQLSCRSETDTTSDFIMHGVKVTSNDNENRSDEGAPLVLLHGYANGALYYYRNLVGLSNNHFGGVVYALDMLGWGLSSRPPFEMKSIEGCDDVDMAEQFYVESLEAWRKAHKLDKMTLGGHSLGGYVSVAYCEKYPQHVDRLILISPAGIPREEKDSLTTKGYPLKVRFIISLAAGFWRSGITPASFVKSLPEGLGKKYAAGYVENRIPAITCVDERASLSEYLYANAVLPGSGANCLNKILKPKPLAYARKPTIDRIPLLNVKDIAIIYGQYDWMDPMAGLDVQGRCEELRNSGKEDTPKISVFGVKNAGHLLMLENWEEFNSAVILAGGGGKRLSKEAHLPFTCSPSDKSDTGFFSKQMPPKNTETQ